MADAITTTTTTTTHIKATTTQQTPNRFTNIFKPTTNTSTSTTPTTPSSTTTSTLANAANRDPIATTPNASCCTKIAVMQLFHEMKQEFATVPDYIVGQHVNANCNNRAALLKALKNESYRFPGSVQAYPQALRHQNQSPNNQTTFNESPIDTSSNADLTSAESSSYCASKSSVSDDANQSPSAATKPPHHPSSPSSSSSLGRRPRVKISHKWPHHQSTPVLGKSTDSIHEISEPIASASNTIQALNLSSRLDSEYSNNDTSTTTTKRDMTTNQQPHRTNAKTTDPLPLASSNPVQTKPKVPQRPRTLNLAPPPNLAGTSSPLQPIRPAPAVPPRPSYLSANTKSIPSPSSSSDPIGAALNVSVNVTVSPITTSPSSVRHTSALNVHPEPPWPVFQSVQPPTQSTPTINQVPPNRSYTSVQFRLRTPMGGSNSEPSNATSTPTDSPHQQPSPIDISAGPTQLTYSSASYDARKGLQSHFQITVDGGGNGSFSATRTRPRYTTPSEGGVTTTPSSQLPPLPFTPPSQQGTIAAAAAAVARTRRTSIGSLVEHDDVISRQNQCKKRLLVELDHERKRLTLMQQEIHTLQAPIPPGGSLQLAEEIRQLQNSCKQMVQLVEEAGPYVIGETNEAFYQQIQSSQSLLHSPYAARSAPPYSLGSGATSSTNHHPSTPSALNSAIGSSPSYFVNHQHQYPQQQSQPPPPSSPPEAQPWSCCMCTFQNHPLLNKCEQCEMPLMTTSGTNTTQTAPYASLAPSQGGASPMTPFGSSPVFALPTRPAPPPPYSRSHLQRDTRHDHPRPYHNP